MKTGQLHDGRRPTAGCDRRRSPHLLRAPGGSGGKPDGRLSGQRSGGLIAHWAKILDDATVTKKAILFNGQVAGNIVSFLQFGTPKVGYWIGKNYWGKGIATKALSEFLGHVKARPLYANVAKHNVGSIRVLEKCGFTICGEDKGPSGAGGEEVEEFVLKLSSKTPV